MFVLLWKWSHAQTHTLSNGEPTIAWHLRYHLPSQLIMLMACKGRAGIPHCTPLPLLMSAARPSYDGLWDGAFSCWCCPCIHSVGCPKLPKYTFSRPHVKLSCGAVHGAAYDASCCYGCGPTRKSPRWPTSAPTIALHRWYYLTVACNGRAGIVHCSPPYHRWCQLPAHHKMASPGRRIFMLVVPVHPL